MNFEIFLHLQGEIFFFFSFLMITAESIFIGMINMLYFWSKILIYPIKNFNLWKKG